MPRSRLALPGCLLIALLAGCTTTREIDARGEVRAPSTMATEPVLLRFFDLPLEADQAETEVESLRLDRAGAFEQRLAVRGDKIRVYALADADADGECSPGEAWTSVEARIRDDDTLEPLTLTLRTIDCPETTP